MSHHGVVGFPIVDCPLVFDASLIGGSAGLPLIMPFLAFGSERYTLKRVADRFLRAARERYLLLRFMALALGNVFLFFEEVP